MNKEALLGMSHDEMRQAYMNAQITYLGAAGLGKAHRNEEQAAEYALQLKANGWSVPTKEDVLQHGIFNGTGSL